MVVNVRLNSRIVAYVFSTRTPKRQKLTLTRLPKRDTIQYAEAISVMFVIRNSLLWLLEIGGNTKRRPPAPSVTNGSLDVICEGERLMLLYLAFKCACSADKQGHRLVVYSLSIMWSLLDFLFWQKCIKDLNPLLEGETNLMS